MDDFEVKFFNKADGTSPVKDYIRSLKPNLQAKMLRQINLLRNKGNALRSPTSKAVRDQIFELRGNVGNDQMRILYFFVQNRTVVLTNGFTKKQNKIPEKEITLAQRYRDEYLKLNV